MAIADPTALPEGPEQLAEYMSEADRLWNDNRTDEAYTLYRSVRASTTDTTQASLAGYRMGLYLQTIGDIDGALLAIQYSNEPGTHDLEVALRASMPDQAVDPSEIPQTGEACERYMDSIIDAFERGDWTTVDALCLAYQQTSVEVGVGRHAVCQTYRGIALTHLGRNDEAREALEYAVANGNSEHFLPLAREALQQIGVQVQDGGNPYQTADSQQLLAGIAAFESDDQQAAATALKSVVDSTTAGPIDKGRAHFYLGSMAYHAGRHDEARTHLHAAESDAPDPEQGWARDMLSWRWQEN
jgi:tetratricopeptide (TPR) repeat protein